VEMAEEQLSKLFRIRRTVHQMLRDRNYLVDVVEINRTRDEFVEQFGDNPLCAPLAALPHTPRALAAPRAVPEACRGWRGVELSVRWAARPARARAVLRSSSRDNLTVLCQKRDDPTQGIFVFFPEEEKVGIKPIRRYCDKMNEEHVTRAILVVQDAMTSHAKQALKETITLGLHMEHFQASRCHARSALSLSLARDLRARGRAPLPLLPSFPPPHLPHPYSPLAAICDGRPRPLATLLSPAPRRTRPSLPDPLGPLPTGGGAAGQHHRARARPKALRDDP
jgi:hypothetical protein